MAEGNATSRTAALIPLILTVAIVRQTQKALTEKKTKKKKKSKRKVSKNTGF